MQGQDMEYLKLWATYGVHPSNQELSQKVLARVYEWIENMEQFLLANTTWQDSTTKRPTDDSELASSQSI